jgi:hypothetical protein
MGLKADVVAARSFAQCKRRASILPVPFLSFVLYIIPQGKAIIRPIWIIHV